MYINKEAGNDEHEQIYICHLLRDRKEINIKNKDGNKKRKERKTRE